MSMNLQFDRRPHRLREWDYRAPGSYFLTLCTNGQYPYFDDRSILSISRKYWREIPQRHPHVELGDYEFVHNHMHGIVTITRYPESHGDKKHPDAAPRGGAPRRGAIHTVHAAPCRGVIHTVHAANDGMAPLPGAMDRHPPHDYHLPGSIGAIIQGYKIITKRVIRFCTRYADFGWQRDIWDHIIQNDIEYARISAYIRNNLTQWDKDRDNPASRFQVPPWAF